MNLLQTDGLTDNVCHMQIYMCMSMSKCFQLEYLRKYIEGLVSIDDTTAWPCEGMQSQHHWWTRALTCALQQPLRAQPLSARADHTLNLNFPRIHVKDTVMYYCILHHTQIGQSNLLSRPRSHQPSKTFSSKPTPTTNTHHDDEGTDPACGSQLEAQPRRARYWRTPSSPNTNPSTSDTRHTTTRCKF